MAAYFTNFIHLPQDVLQAPYIFAKVFAQAPRPNNVLNSTIIRVITRTRIVKTILTAW